MEKVILALLLVGFIAAPALAQCVDDGKCTKEEVGLGNCTDCRTYVPAKDYCVDDGICTEIEESQECSDCVTTEAFGPTGFAVFVWGIGALIGVAVLALVFFFGRMLIASMKEKKRRKPTEYRAYRGHRL